MRAGIHYHQVADAATRLQGQGRNPTIDSVREQLGTGSRTTIGRHLREWKAQQGLAVTDKAALPSELQALVHGLWERLLMESEQKIAEIQSDAAKKTATLEEQLIQERQQHQSSKQQIQALKEKSHSDLKALEQHKNTIAQKEMAFQKLTERHQVLTQRLDEQKSENKRLHELLSNNQANLEHYHQSMQQHQEEQRMAFEKQNAQEAQRSAALTQTLEQIKIEKQKLERDFDKLTTVHHHLEQTHQEKTNVLSKLQKKYEEKIIRLSQLETRAKDMQQQAKTLASELKEKTSLIANHDKELSVIMTRHTDVQALLADTKDEVCQLRDENYALKHEAATLKKQCQQLQKSMA